MKLSDAQYEIMEAMVEGHAPCLHWYGGPPGAEGKGAGYYWRQWVDRGKPKPKTDTRSVDGLLRRDLIVGIGDGDYGPTERGRELFYVVREKRWRMRHNADRRAQSKKRP